MNKEFLVSVQFRKVSLQIYLNACTLAPTVTYTVLPKYEVMKYCVWVHKHYTYYFNSIGINMLLTFFTPRKLQVCEYFRPHDVTLHLESFSLWGVRTITSGRVNIFNVIFNFETFTRCLSSSHTVHLQEHTVWYILMHCCCFGLRQRVPVYYLSFQKTESSTWFWQ